MRRRLFWTIAAVAVLSGLLVLAGAAIASQRAAREATFREMKQSVDEAARVLEEFSTVAERRPGAFLDLVRLVEGDQVSPVLGRLRRAAGGSDIAFAAVTRAGEVRSTSDLFDQLDVDARGLREGQSQFGRLSGGELVVVSPTELTLGDEEGPLVVMALSREAPVISFRDTRTGFLLVFTAVVALAALVARLLSERLGKTLQPLVEASRSLADGDMTARAPGLEDPELGSVATAFNEMADRLALTKKMEQEFILGIGHDLRTPLTTIRGYAEALEAGHVDLDETRRIGEVLSRQSAQMSRLIQDLSMLASLERPEFDLRPEPVAVGPHLEDALSGLRVRAEEKGVVLNIQSTGQTTFVTDADRVAQIVQNLVENAIRHTPEGGRVDVGVDVSGDGMALTVVDTGSGISESELPHIFDRHRAVRHFRSGESGGSGLGLSIVQGLVQRMGGAIRAESKVGEGTTITVTLPG